MASIPLLEQVRRAVRTRHLSRRTEKAYVRWVYRFVRYHGTRHPAGMGASEVRVFLSYLAVERNVSASTQNQALAALLFLYRHVLEVELPALGDVVPARRPRRLPVVLTREEVRLVLLELKGTHVLVASLLYGAGLRLLEGLRLRVKDLDFDSHSLVVRRGKGAKDRVSVLPERLVSGLGSTWSASGGSTRPMWRWATAACGSRRRWRASIRLRIGAGAGSTYSRRGAGLRTRCRARCGVTISTSPRCRRR